jgi:MFS family permease
MRAYLRMLRNRPFAALWAGSTISSLGDALTWVSLVWIVYSLTGSARDVSLLVVVYTAPVIVGGLVMGPVLDRFDRRRVLIAVNAFLGMAVASVPVLSGAGRLRIWHLEVVAGLYGLLKMANLAGVPSMLPSLVAEEDLNTANAMESISYWVSDVGGPALAGLLIGIVGGANVLIVDAGSYLLFIAFLTKLRVPDRRSDEAEPAEPAGGTGLRPAVRFVRRSPAILAITIMFMAFNVGEGMLFVLLPVHARTVLGGGAGTYGWLLSTFALAALVGSTLVGAVRWRWTLGRSIALAQALAGLAFIGLVAKPGLLGSMVVLAVAGGLSAPLTIWAQTVRMRLIPAEMRGRVFGLLRTAMQSTPPVGAAVAGWLLGGGTESRLAVVVLVTFMSVPGLIGLGPPRPDGPADPSRRVPGGGDGQSSNRLKGLVPSAPVAIGRTPRGVAAPPPGRGGTGEGSVRTASPRPDRPPPSTSPPPPRRPGRSARCRR